MKARFAVIPFLIMAIAAGLPVPASNNDSFSKGIDEFNAGRWNSAATELQTAAAQMPRDEVVRLTAGVALANVKRYPEAAAQFQSAASLAPAGILPLMLLDSTYTELGNTAAARQAKNRANAMLSEGRAFGGPQSSDTALAASLTRYPRNAIATCLLGDSYQLQGKLEAARAQYSKAAALAPRWPKPIFNLGLANLSVDPKAAEASFNQAISMDPSNSRAYLWLGDAYLKQKAFNKAIKAYSVAAKDKTLAADARIRTGNAQMQAGDYSGASQQFADAATAMPQDARPLAGQAQVYQNMGDLQKAETTYKQAGQVLEQNSGAKSSQAVVNRQVATVQAAQGKLKDANTTMGTAFNQQPNLYNANVLVETQAQANLIGQGIAQYEDALRKNPRDVRAMLYLLPAYKANGNNQGRLDMAMRLIKADPANACAYYTEVGCAQMAVGNSQKALDAFVLAMDCGDATTWANTGKAAEQCGALALVLTRYESAFAKTGNVKTGKVLFDLQSVAGDVPGMISTAQKLVRTAPDDPTLLLRLGEAYERAGRKLEAMAVYTKVSSGADTDAAAIAKARLGALKDN